MAHGCRVSLGDDDSIVKLVVMVTQSCDYANIAELLSGLHDVFPSQLQMDI